MKLGTREAAIGILCLMWLVEFAAWIALGFFPEQKDLQAEVAKLFLATNFGLATVLNSSAKNDSPPPGGGAPNPTK